FVVADRPGVDHLRPRLQVRVQAEQLVVDHVAVRDGDGRRGEDRVEYAQRRVHDRFQRRFRRGGSGEGKAGTEKTGGDTAGSSKAKSAPDKARKHRATSLFRTISEPNVRSSLGGRSARRQPD